MDIKDLNKPQMVLLVLLISFVVSIATAVSVVSLMQQEPTTVTQTINRVIKQTIEKVSVEEAPQKNTTTEDKNSINISDEKPLVELYSMTKPTDENKSTETRKQIGKAVVISNTGLVFVDAPLVSDLNVYQVVLDKNYFNLEIVNKVGSVYIMQVVSKADAFVSENKQEEASVDVQ